MAAKRHERTRARRAALQVLYTSEIRDMSPVVAAEAGSRLAEDGPLHDYGLSLVRGIHEHKDAIDEHLVQTSENWSLARMPIVDRSILRLATYEMMYVDDVPTSVAINEAVELAKDFGGEDESPRFVNGVLGRIAKRLEEEAEGGAPAPEGEPCASVPAETVEPAQADRVFEASVGEAGSQPAKAPAEAGAPAAEEATHGA